MHLCGNERGGSMSDFLWFVIIGVLFVLLGLVFMLLGWHIWKEQKMTLIISHHCDKVSDENKKAYCTLSGVGIFIIGIGFVFSGICTFLLQSAPAFIPMVVGLVVGMAFFVSAVIRYNR